MENTIELLGTYGDDELHCLSAWCSTKRELTAERRGRMDKMLAVLAENEHETPFEKSALHFLVTCDIASHIHLLKHRIGVSINAESARYKELKEDKFYVPHDWPDDMQVALIIAVEASQKRYHEFIAELVSRGMDRKRAKESARYILPYASQITQDVMFNWRSFSHFLRLRNTPHAQLEIREIAREMLRLVEELPGAPFQYTIEAFRSIGGLGDA